MDLRERTPPGAKITTYYTFWGSLFKVILEVIFELILEVVLEVILEVILRSCFRRFEVGFEYFGVLKHDFWRHPE